MYTVFVFVGKRRKIFKKIKTANVKKAVIDYIN